MNESSESSPSKKSSSITTNLGAIIRALEEAGENDNRKIALLLILCELIRTGQVSSERLGRAGEERLFAAIGAHFLARLLVTRQAAPASNCSPHIYKSVCLSILGQFCEHPALVQDPLILTRLSAFFDVLKTPLRSSAATFVSDDERSLIANLKLDTFRYLFAVAKLNAEYLCNNGLMDALFESVILNESESVEYKLLGKC